jgi:hypothetical protein
MPWLCSDHDQDSAPSAHDSYHVMQHRVTLTWATHRTRKVTEVMYAAPSQFHVGDLQDAEGAVEGKGAGVRVESEGMYAAPSH